MKIGILTFHCAINYGAVLQAYGLQEVLKGMGHDVYIIDYRPEYLKKPYRLFFTEAVKGRGFLGNIRFFIRELFAIPIRYKRRCAFNAFIEKYLHLVNIDLQSENNDFDCFVFGSDQIWNLQITGGDYVYFGEAPCFKGKRLLTYAASAGNVSSLKDIDEYSLKSWLSNFSSLSVRENSLSDYLKELLFKTQLVIDPVLLAGMDVYSKITSSTKTEKPYLLFFSIGQNDEALNVAKKKAMSLGLELIQMYGMAEIIKNKKALQSISPNDFIVFFKNAKYVISSSFHGTVFSILFHKPFLCVGHDFKSRFHSLLQMFGLSDRLVDAYSVMDLNFEGINWDFIDEVLSQQRKDSICYLEKSFM